MKPTFRFAAATAAIFSCLTMTAQAQVVHPEEQVQPYGQTRGWSIYSIQHSYSGFIGCRAAKYENGAQLVLELYAGMWQIVVPTTQTGMFGGAVLGVDKADFDAQFGFDSGYATKELTPTELNYIKQGNHLTIDINGDYPRYWSLAGSSAAILKVQECATYGGVAPTTQAAEPQKPPQSGSNTLSANCDSPTTGPYQCTVTSLAPEVGYREAYQIENTYGQTPAYFFKVRSDHEAEVWVSFDRGPWQFLGVWEPLPHDQNCTVPRAQQEAAAWENLGQDAWELCVR